MTLVERIKEKIMVVLKYTGIAVVAGICIAFALSVLLFFGIFIMNYKWSEVLFICASIAVIGFIIVSVLMHLRKVVKLAFSDPEVLGYERKTDKELYTFVAQSCVLVFIIALISFQAMLIYIALTYWFYFIIFMLMFSKVWKFHGKKRSHLFAILLITTAASFIIAPAVRYGILKIIVFFNIAW